MQEPKLSIITINLNNHAGLQKTMESVFSQTFTDYEYIIIDGGSIDGSKELIEKHQNKFVCAVSEKDEGIYQAMNKGILKANGEYLLFLNSGDYLYEDLTLSLVFRQIKDADIIYGNIKWMQHGQILNGMFPQELTFEFFMRNSLPHQGTFIRKKVFEIVGLYDENYKIISDWILFLLAIYKFNCTHFYIDKFVSVCERNGISCLPENWPLIVKDRKEVIKKHFTAFEKDLKGLYELRNELLARTEELKKIKKTFGYRLQDKFIKLILK